MDKKNQEKLEQMLNEKQNLESKRMIFYDDHYNSQDLQIYKKEYDKVLKEYDIDINNLNKKIKLLVENKEVKK